MPSLAGGKQAQRSWDFVVPSFAVLLMQMNIMSDYKRAWQVTSLPFFISRHAQPPTVEQERRVREQMPHQCREALAQVCVLQLSRLT